MKTKNIISFSKSASPAQPIAKSATAHLQPNSNIAKTPSSRNEKTFLPARFSFNSRHLLFFAFSIFAFFSFFFLAGCTDNSNLTYTSCCWEKAEPYECTILFDNNGKPITDADGNFPLSNECGNNCVKLSSDMQKVFDSSGAKYDISLCANNCNFRQADCDNSNNNNTCYIMKEGATTETSLGPICANATANPCVQSQCSAMFCGEPVPKPQSGIDAKSSINASDDLSVEEANAYKKASQEVAGGLIDKICKIEPINRQNARLLTSDSWFVNSLRLGIQGNFADYDRIRYYLPPSDFYAGLGNLNSVVDKFTNYLDVDKDGEAGPLEIFGGSTKEGTCKHTIIQKDDPWIGFYTCDLNGFYEYYKCDGSWEQCEPKISRVQLNCEDKCKEVVSSNFKAPLTTCKPEFLPNTAEIVSYNCTSYVTTTNKLRFPLSTYSTAESARLACMKTCVFSQYRTCDENTELFLTSFQVSPRPIGTKSSAYVSWPFTDIYKYGQELAKAYPTPAPDENLAPENDPRNYYKALLSIPQRTNYGSDEYNAAMLQYSIESSKPGPAGAKVFECIENSDCMGGTCDRAYYSRGSCYLNNGTPVDCGCHYVTNCKLDYMCENMEAQTTLQAECIANKEICEQSFGLGGNGEQGGEPMVVCDYQYTKIGTFAGDYYIPYTVSGDAAEGCWADEGCYSKNGQQIPDGYIGIKQFQDFSCVMGGSSIENGGKRQPDIEMGVIKRYMKNTPICVKSDKSGEVAPAFCSGTGKPETNCYGGFESKKHGDYFVASACGSSKDEPGWIDDIHIWSGLTRDDYKCPPGYDLELKGDGWKDDDIAYSGDPVHIYSNWGEAMEPVPSKQAVGNPVGRDTFIRTSENVEWCDEGTDGYLSLSGLKGTCGYDENTGKYSCTCTKDKFSWEDTKFKVIQACNLQLRQPGQSEADPDWDVELVQPNFYNGNEYPPARKISTWAYQSRIDNPDILKGTINSGYIYLGKTWRIRSMGDCQTDEKGRLTIVNYGMCKPAGTVLSLAYQNISNYPSSLKSYCPLGCRSNTFTFIDTDYCQCPGSSIKTVTGKVNGGYITNPDYTFLSGKIDEYHSAGIIPLLDMRKYKFNVPEKQADFCIERWNSCEEFGAIQTGTCVEEFPIVYGINCTISSYSDMFLEYLAKKHSASILEVHDLPSNCPDSEECADAGNSLSAATDACPDCLLALEYPALIDASKIKDYEFHYPDKLRNAIEAYTEYDDNLKVKFDIERAQAPFEWIPTVPGHIENVSVLVLNLDLSNLETADKALLGAQLDAATNMSRRVLQHVGWPTIWKLNYKRADGAKSFEKSIIYEKLYARERELTLSGVLGILLPPLDNGDTSTTSTIYDSEEFGRLLNPKGSDVKDTTTAFCAAQEGSKEFLHPSIMAGVRRIYAKETCACMQCSPYEITASVCTSRDAACLDGQACTINSNSGDNFKCEATCIYSTCPLCDDSNRLTTCTAVQTTNKPPVECCKNAGDTGCQNWPDCGKWTGIKVSELSDISLHPDSAYLISGLPKDEMCCVQNITTDADGNKIITKYTYLQSSSLSMQSEPTVFPSYGSNETDCGRQVAVGLGKSAVCGMPAPPIINVIWSCSKPY